MLSHALIDALLGACGLGDIGDHFPPGDPEYHGIDSMTLLQRVQPRITQAGYAPVNMDATVFLEAPPLTPHKARIGIVWPAVWICR